MNPTDLPRQPPPAPDMHRPVDSTPESTLDSATLFEGRTEIGIRHNGRVYRLRRTRLGKLILTA